MRLVHCKKCGALISTVDSQFERIMDEIQEEQKLAIKDRKNQSVHLQKAKTMQKFLNQMMHTSAQLEERKTTCLEELSVIVNYIIENNLVTKQELSELRDIARNRAKRKNAADERELERLMKSYSDYTGNRTKSDPTANKAISRK